MSIFSSLLGPAISVGGLLYGQSQQNKATKRFANQTSQPPPSVSGPLGYYSNQSFGFSPQSQANFNAFNKAALDELNNFSSYKGVSDTAYSQLQALTGPGREVELDKLRSTLYGQGRLDLGQYRPSYLEGAENVNTNPELQSFYEAARGQDLEQALQAIKLQDLLKSNAATRAAGLQGGAVSLSGALGDYGKFSALQQQQNNLAYREQLDQGLANANNWSSLLTSLGGDIFESVTGQEFPGATSILGKGLSSLFGGDMPGGTSPFGGLFGGNGANPLTSLLGGNPLGNLGSALGLGLPNAVNGIIPSMSAFGLAGLSPSASLALSGPLGGFFGQGAAASAAGAAGTAGAGGLAGIAAGLGPIGLGALGLIGGLGMMNIGGNEKAVYMPLPPGVASVESSWGDNGNRLLKPGRAGDEHGKTVPGKPASIGYGGRILARPSKQAEAMQLVQAENQAAIRLFGADIYTLGQRGFFNGDAGQARLYRISQVGRGAPDSGATSWKSVVSKHNNQYQARKAQQRARSSERGGGDR